MQLYTKRVAAAPQPCGLSSAHLRQHACRQAARAERWLPLQRMSARHPRRTLTAAAAANEGGAAADARLRRERANQEAEEAVRAFKKASAARYKADSAASETRPQQQASGGKTPPKKQAEPLKASKAGTGPGRDSGRTSATAKAPSEGPSAEETKMVLLDSLYGTERGLSVSSELRGEIGELIMQLEAGNPSETADPDQLSGEWKLVYTYNSELSALLALSKLPFVTVGDITQTIDGAAGTVVNKATLMDGVTRTAFSSTANFEERSSKLLNIKFVRGALATPQLLTDIDIPESVSLLGQTVDLRDLREALAPARRSLQDAFSQAASFLSQQPDLSFDIPEGAQQESWLLTTYLDEDMRVARGDGNSVFVLVKEPGSASTAGKSYSNAATQNGNGSGGAWKDDPLRNGYSDAAVVTPPAMNVEPQLNGEGDINSY